MKTLGVSILGAGHVATEMALLWAAAGVEMSVYSRGAERIGWLLEDVLDAVPDARIRAAASAEEAVEQHDVALLAVPWGDGQRRLLLSLAEQLPGRTVIDPSNPFEMTALGPKIASYVPGGSAAAGTAAALPEGTGHVHAFSHVRADALRPGGAAGCPLPYVSNSLHDDAALPLLLATGWVPGRVGDLDSSAQIEAGGAWERAAGRSGLDLRSWEDARAAGLV